MEEAMSDTLRQFQIDNLHNASPEGDSRGLTGSTENQRTSTDLNSQHGLVRISDSDYDQIASNQPRAMLMYVDDEEDKEVITVSQSATGIFVLS